MSRAPCWWCWTVCPETGGTGSARGTGHGRWRRTGAAETLTGGPRRAQGLDGASGSAWCTRRPPCRAPPVTRGAGEVESEVVGAGGRLGREGVLLSGDQKRAAPPGPCPCRSWHAQAMPVSASAPISQLRDQKGMGFASLCAKFQTLQLCRSNFLQIRKSVRSKVSENSAGQKWKVQFGQAKHFCFG